MMTEGEPSEAKPVPSNILDTWLSFSCNIKASGGRVTNLTYQMLSS